MYPEGLYRALVRVATLGKPIYVTENGIADVTDDRQVSQFSLFCISISNLFNNKTNKQYNTNNTTQTIQKQKQTNKQYKQNAEKYVWWENIANSNTKHIFLDSFSTLSRRSLYLHWIGIEAAIEAEIEAGVGISIEIESDRIELIDHLHQKVRRNPRIVYDGG